METLAQMLQAARESGNVEQIAYMQRVVVLASSMPYLLTFMILYVAWGVWVVCVMPCIIRRLRDAGLNLNWYCLAAITLPIPWLYYSIRTTDKLLSLPHEQVLDISQDAWLVCLGAAGISVLLTLGMAFGFQSKHEPGN